MSFELSHTLIFNTFAPSFQTSDEQVIFKANERGEFPVLFTGRLIRSASATLEHLEHVEPVPSAGDFEPASGPGGGDTTPLQAGGTAERHAGNETIRQPIHFTVRIFTPDGVEFTATNITRADLQKFRDQRGSPSGPWSYTITGETAEQIFLDKDSTLGHPKLSRGRLNISIQETIRSESAPPLVNDVPVIPTRLTFQFDLYRVGMFVAQISQLQIGAPWRGTMRLIDPDGVAVARTTGRKLTFDVGLRTLNKSRDAAGKVRKWTLDVSPQGGVIAGKPHISATVIGSGRVNLDPIRSRILALLGPHGNFIKIFGEDKNGEALARLMIKDVVSVESIDMYGVLEKVLSETLQDPGVDSDDLRVNTVYTLGRKPEEQAFGTKLKVGSFKIDTIEVEIGPGVKLGAAIPAIRVTVAVSGKGKIKFEGLTIADIEVPDNKIEIEIGVRVSADGTPETVAFVPDTLVEGHINTGAAVVIAASLPFPLNLIGVFGIEKTISDKVRDINDSLVKGIRETFSNPSLAPQILMMMFGTHFTYLPVRFEGDEILFEHIAPVEPEPKPTPGYRGAIGRSFTTNAITFSPPLLGDTWRADKLNKNIKHIVVVMMENRSYDHVLGYRAQAPFNDGADGLTTTMVEDIQNAPNGPFVVRNLHDADFDKNKALLMTRLPKRVGHELSDVQQQLRFRFPAPGADNRTINSPKGFVDNFRPRLTLAPNEQPHHVVADDVLGFYDERELLFFKYLADNYAYSDRFFSSHPGPTLPNRMYSLTGDLQHDRYGFPILASNNGDNFLLSRETTIYDLMARKGLSFRVYESEPSVTMLRMFARYATDNKTIVPIAQLEPDMARGGQGLPDFTVIEPQMHAHPEDDDHPDADMYRGQQFVKRVYDALTSNATLWEKTLLIITYDEHGGLYDHVVPPIADIYNVPGEPVLDSGAGGSSPAPQVLLTVPYGVRVPTFVVSPWTAPGKGPSITLDHCSILKTVLARFMGAEKPFLSDRVNASLSFEDFLTEVEPRMDVPRSPSLPPLPLGERKKAPSPTTKIITKPVSRKEMREGPVDYHEISGRWARQLGR